MNGAQRLFVLRYHWRTRMHRRFLNHEHTNAHAQKLTLIKSALQLLSKRHKQIRFAHVHASFVVTFF